MSTGATILLAAGGTGGHLFPAEALARVLVARGYTVDLATDARGLAYGGDFPARARHLVPAATPTGAGLASKLRALAILARGTLTARALVGRLRPAVVVGFGGYPSVPPLLAAALAGVPTLLHEQNAVMGRANRFLAGRAARVATGFTTLGGVSDGVRAKLVHTGNPVRPAVVAAAALPFPPTGTLHLLVTGGSQGARVLSDVVPAAIEALPALARARLALVQQARAEDLDRVRAIYARLGVAADAQAFFADLPQHIAGAHLVVARAGASTVAELAAIGRASILVPLPGSLDQDQAANAATLAARGAATVIPQADFTPARLAAEIAAALDNPAALADKAAAARAAGILDAAERLADCVATLIPKRDPAP